MRALTINQPYAHLIVTQQSELKDGAFQKRVENRIWQRNVFGEIAIHAGLSLRWFDGDDYPCSDGKLTVDMFPEMSFGAVVGIAEFIACISKEDIRAGNMHESLKWLQTHPHVSGPFCYVLGRVRRLKEPVACKGAQGIWYLRGETRKAVEGAELIDIPFNPEYSQYVKPIAS
jgi:hypothetical protein